MKKILLFSKYSRMGASSRLRTHQYIPYLESQGHEITVSSLFNDEYLIALYDKSPISFLFIAKLYFRRFLKLLTCYKYDVIWIEKELFPYVPATFERILKVFGVSYVVDFDDAIFHNYDLSNNKLIRCFLRKKIDKVMALSSTTVVGNQYLANRAHSAGAKNVMIIPTVVDINRYSVQQNENPIPVIGWIGSPSTQKYIIELWPVFIELANTTDFKLRLVGATADIVNQLPGIDVEVVKWREDTEVSDIQSIDVGIMPLHDGPWEKGKCGYKLIQYMACGKPVVASKVGANVDIVNSGYVGMLASNHSEFLESLTILLQGDNLRLTMGLAGRKQAKERYSVQKQLVNLNKLFHSIID